MKIVINRCFGNFGLSEKACQYMGLKCDGYDYKIPRNDERLVKCVEKLGVKANGLFAKLKVVEIPDDVEWEIINHDGMETIEEVHRSWC